MSCPQDKNRDADEIKHDRRHVHHVVGPVAPPGEKTVKVAEYFLGPKIHAPFSRVTMSEFDYGNSLRPEEKNQGNHPQPDGDAAIGRDGGKNIQVENGDDKKKNEVPFAQNPARPVCFAGVPISLSLEASCASRFRDG